MNITYNELKRRLKNLYFDMKCSNDDVLNKLAIYDLTKSDKEEFLRDLYAADSITIKITDYSKCVYNLNVNPDILEQYLAGFDEFREKKEKEIDRYVEDNRIAIEIFRNMISLDSPFSDILYLTYYKRVPQATVQQMIIGSRPTYYRLKRKAIQLLLLKCNNSVSEFENRDSVRYE